MLLSDAFRIGGLMPAASLETTLELWSTTLRQAKHRIRPLFAAPSVAASANAFLDGLLGAERRKTGWMRAEAAGDPGPWRQQAILGRSHWNADALRDGVRDHVIETLGAPEAVLVIDETGFLKQGHASIDRELYLPKAWTGDPARMTAAHVQRASPSRPSHTWRSAWSSGRSRRACRLPGSRPTASTAWARSSWRCGGPTRVMFSVSRASTHSGPGGPRPRCRARPRRSRQPSWRRTGSASRRGRARRGRACTTGPIWSWLR